MLIAGVSKGRDALLDVENQHLRARGPIALAVLGDDLLRQRQGTVFRFFGFFLIGLGLVDLDQRGAARSRVVQRFGRGGRLLVLFRVLLVHVGFFVRALRRALPVAAE